MSTIIGSCSGFIVGLMVSGLLVAFAAGGAGAAVGSYLGKMRHGGYMQKACYWQLPLGKLLINKKVPSSETRRYI